MYKYLFLFIHFTIHSVGGENSPIVTTTQGLVTGLVSEDGGYYMYLGIPYGVVDPENPFGPSSPHPAFEGTFDAIDDSALCPQIEEFNQTLAGTLDCLHLSVFVPKTTDNTPKAVIVWIYGGRFELGFYGRYLYGPKFLVRHDIILVSLNYRLGPYGFMCTDNARVPGNQGFKDQLIALRWIHENIASFGGDPNKVTISGNSAGGMSSEFHILKNYEPRLFNQAILQSGTALAVSYVLPDKNAPLTLSQHFGFQTNDISTSLDFLATIDPLDVIEASNTLGFAFRPCIEESFEGVESFVSQNWMTNENLPFAKDMNIIIGFNDDESLSFVMSLNRSLENAVNETLGSTFDIEHEKFTGEDIVRHFFFGDDVGSAKLQGAVDMRSDMSFIYPSWRSANRLLNNQVGKLFLYLFTYSGGRNFIKQKDNITQGGAVHADEIGYLFDIEYMEEPNEEDQLVLDAMTEMWANFAKYGDPTPQISNLLPQKWEAVTSTTYHYMDIGLELKAGTRPLQERMTFWDMFFETYGHLQYYMLNDVDEKRIQKWLLNEMMSY